MRQASTRVGTHVIDNFSLISYLLFPPLCALSTNMNRSSTGLQSFGFETLTIPGTSMSLLLILLRLRLPAG